MSELEKQSESVAKADKADKADKKAPQKSKDKKPGFFARAGRWFREMRSELKKVSWPTFKETMKNVGTVIACVLIVGVFIWLFDWLARAVIEALIKLFG